MKLDQQYINCEGLINKAYNQIFFTGD